MPFFVDNWLFSLYFNNLRAFKVCVPAPAAAVTATGTTWRRGFFLWITWCLCQNCPQLYSARPARLFFWSKRPLALVQQALIAIKNRVIALCAGQYGRSGVRWGRALGVRRAFLAFQHGQLFKPCHPLCRLGCAADVALKLFY